MKSLASVANIKTINMHFFTKSMLKLARQYGCAVVNEQMNAGNANHH